jgi:hypothetical protein
MVMTSANVVVDLRRGADDPSAKAERVLVLEYEYGMNLPKLRWDSETVLKIDVPPSATVGLRRNEYSGISIHFETQ